MKCESCGAEIHEIITRFFDREGDDYERKIPIDECEDVDTVEFDVGCNWCDYELSEEERHEGTLCPNCGKPPFKNHEVQTYIRVVRFKTTGAA